MVRKAALVLILSSSAAQAQLSSTNCIRGAYGSVYCSTISQPQTQYVNQDWGAVFQKIHDQHVQRKLGKMIAAGDCQGAFNYAVQESMELARQVREICPVPNR